MKATNKNSNADELALKEAVQEALGSYDSTVVMQMLTQQGYDPFYAQQLIEEAEDEAQSAKPVIPETVEEVKEETVMQEEDPMEQARQALIAESQQEAIDADEEDDAYQDITEQEYFGFANGGLVKANYGIEMPNTEYNEDEEQSYITWPTMEGDLMRNGGVPNKRAFLKKMTKHLMKANLGMEQNSDTPSPYGDVSNPMGNNVSGKKNFLSAVNNQAQMFQAKEKAQQMYNNMYGMAEGGDTSTFGPPLDQHDPMEHLNIYGESLSREFQDPTSMETKQMQFGGGMRNRRITRANKALFGVPMMPPGTSVDYEFGPLGGLRRASAETDLTQFAQLFKMLPGSPNANPLATLPDLIATMQKNMPSKDQIVKEVITAINNQSIKEVASSTGNQAAQTKSNETPTITTSNVIPNTTAKVKSNYQPSPKPVNTTKSNNQAKVQAKPTVSSTVNKSGLPTIGKRKEEVKPELRKKVSKGKTYYDLGSMIYRYGMQGKLPWFMEEGGFVDTENPDLYKFIYGGDDISIPYIEDTDMYREGGYLPRADNGLSAFDQFRLQKTNPDGTLKNKPTLSGGEELMGNPYRQGQQSSGNGFQVGQRVDFGQMPGVIPWNTGQQQMNPQQMQQYMQMMQQMQGQNPFAYGAPRGLGLGRAALQGLTGLSRDFNYFTGDNPGNWNIPEGYTNLKKETFKDRGKWYSPFDTKRVTTYEYSKPGEPGTPPAGAPGAIPETTPKVENAPGYDPNAAGPGYSGYNADANGDNIPDYLAGTPSTGEDTKELSKRETRRNERDIRRNERDRYPRSNVKGLEDESRVSVRAGERATRRDLRRGERKDPNAFYEGEPKEGMNAPMSDADYMAKVQFNRTLGADNVLPTAPRTGTGTGMSSVFGGLEGPGVNSPVSNPLVKPNPIQQPLYRPGSGSGSGMYNVGEEFEDGGYVPSYYTFGGYLPMADNGIISDTPDFQNPQDPNAIKYKIEEQSAWSMNPSVLGENIGIGANMFADQEGAFRTMQNKRYNANKTNFASDIDRELTYRGITDQEGIDKKAGFESGRTYTGKYGGSKYKAGGQYKTGGVYSLTQAEIDQIRKMGGDVEFI
jgi:hypothetical protein